MRSAQASIVKLGKDHYRVFVEAGRDLLTGKRKRISKTVRGSRKDAERAKVELLVKAGETEACSYLTVREYASTVYLPSKAEELNQGVLKQRTYESYSDRIRLYIDPYLGDMVLGELDPSEIKRWLGVFSTQPKKHEALRMLSMVCHHAMYEGHLKANPCDMVRPPKVDKYEPDVLDEQDIEVYLWHFRDTRIEPIVLLAMGGAFRRGEMVALNAEDINFTTGATIVDDAFVESKKGPIREKPKTKTSTRTTYLPDVITERLRILLPESGPIACRLDGERLAPNSVRKLYVGLRDTIPEGVPRVSLKNLRHSSLTLAFDTGADILDVSNRAGHSDTRITTDRYVRPKGSRDKRTAKLMDTALRANQCQPEGVKLVSGQIEAF